MNETRRQWGRTYSLLWPLCVLLGLLAGCDSPPEDSPQRPDPSALLEFQIRCTLLLSVTETDILAQVTIENAAKQPMKFLKWNLPADGVMVKPLFEIEHEGVRVPYTGKDGKLDTPRAEDYLLLKSGERATTTIPLKQAYNIREPGRYTIRYRGYNSLPGGEGPEEILSNLVTMRVQPWVVEDFYMRCQLDIVVTDNDIVATITLENATQRWPVRILQEDLPYDGILNKPLFIVERNGVKVPYSGKQSKRSFISTRPADYLTMRPGDEIIATMALGKRYDFSKPGEYSVRYKTFVLDAHTLEVTEVLSNKVFLQVR